MAKTEIRGGSQILDNTVVKADLVLDFLGAVDWDVTNGAKNATLKGLKDAVLNDSPATLGQLNASIAGLQSMTYKGIIDVVTPTPDLSTIASSVGDFYLVSVAGTYLGKIWAIGDMLIVNKDVAIGAITNADVDKIDNTEDPTIIKQANIVDNVTSSGVTTAPLSANQGFVLKGLIDSINANVKLRKYGEALAVTHNSAVLPALANTPVAGTVQVYLNGLRMLAGSGNDFTVTGSVITMEYLLKTNDQVQVDYEY